MRVSMGRSNRWVAVLLVVGGAACADVDGTRPLAPRTPATSEDPGEVNGAITGLAADLETDTGAFLAVFPLKSPSPTSPTQAPINSVFDHHHADPADWYVPNDGRIRALNGILAAKTFGFYAKSPDCYAVQGSSAVPDLFLPSVSTVPLVNYVARACPAAYLSYDDHPGIDYRTIGTRTGPPVSLPVYAPVAGTITYNEPAHGTTGDFNPITIIAANGWRVRFLHMANETVNGQMQRWVYGTPGAWAPCPPSQCAPDAPGTRVAAGQQIGFSGGFENGNPSPNKLHLHMEVIDPAGVPRDPYGWQTDTLPDTYSATNYSLWKRPAAVTPAPGTMSLDFEHACALGSTGVANCWGSDNVSGPPVGRLGDGLFSSHYVPQSVAGGRTFVSMSSGGGNCALTGVGALWCWGPNALGNFGDGTTTGSGVPVPAAGALRFTRVAATAYYTCGIDTVGALYCWGWTVDGVLGEGTLGVFPNPPLRLTPQLIGGTRRWRAVAAGGTHSCAIDTNGIAFCWGSNLHGQLGSTTPGSAIATPKRVNTTERFVAIGAAAYGFTCAVSTRGIVYCWGRGGFLGDGGTVGRLTPAPIASARTFTNVTVGSAHACARTVAGRVLCWGASDGGRLGDGQGWIDGSRPVLVGGEMLFSEVHAGAVFTCGRTKQGEEFCWGENWGGQIGDGTTVDRWLPTPTVVP